MSALLQRGRDSARRHEDLMPVEGGLYCRLVALQSRDVPAAGKP